MTEKEKKLSIADVDFCKIYTGKKLDELTQEEKDSWDARVDQAENKALIARSFKGFKWCGATAKQIKESGFENAVSLTAAQDYIFRECMEYTAKITDNPTARILTLIGESGTGKSFFALSCLKKYSEQVRPPIQYKTASGEIKDCEFKTFYTVKYTTSEELCAKIAGTYDTRDKTEKKSATTVDLLCIDEVGRTYAQKKNESDILFSVLEKRINGGLPTIFVSNYNIDEFSKNMGNAFMSRIASKGIILSFDNIEDMRTDENTDRIRQIQQARKQAFQSIPF